MKLKIFKYKKVKSTNDIAIRKIRSGIKNGIVTSDLQSSAEAGMEINGFPIRAIFS